ncbi:dCMP deaminase [Streptomyces flavofungini]|uniref:dCMP deaminase n=2 Tax=Streptomyces flavofungini TaxID=68200 RepID=A0ABS0XH69_9ACTN|nr:dCMP deaminase [Streptomyces flavofungini]
MAARLRVRGHGGTITAMDRMWMRQAIDLAGRCPPSDGAFSVGAVLVDASGQKLACGYSREDDPHVHAEESALGKLNPADARLTGSALYTTLEPCSQRKSRPVTCTEHILRTQISRVIIAWREPSLLVADCVGVETLRADGVIVDELPDWADAAHAVNAHLLGLPQSDKT